jgi:hypothetical protein
VFAYKFEARLRDKLFLGLLYDQRSSSIKGRF